ncbi:hypothetical protein [Streptomyces sp. NPDC058486]
MAITRKRAGITAAVLAVMVAAWAGISYATNTPPFKKPRGTVEATELCPSLGNAQEAADILNRLLPYAVAYRVPYESSRRRGSSETDLLHYSLCFVNGDGDRLLTVKSELESGESREVWQERVLANTVDGEAQSFQGGRWAFTSVNRRVAAVYSACLPSSDSGLTTYVKLTRPAPADRLDDLRRLAEIAAEQAHEAARCTIPADTPRT